MQCYDRSYIQETCWVVVQTAAPCRELGFTPVEVNASDTRNKADNNTLKGMGGKLSNSIRELATNTAIGLDVNNKPKRVSQLCCVLLCYVVFCHVLLCCPVWIAMLGRS